MLLQYLHEVSTMQNSANGPNLSEQLQELKSKYVLTRRNDQILKRAFACEEQRKKLESENKSLFRQLNAMSDKYANVHKHSSEIRYSSDTLIVRGLKRPRTPTYLYFWNHESSICFATENDLNDYDENPKTKIFRQIDNWNFHVTDQPANSIDVEFRWKPGLHAPVREINQYGVTYGHEHIIITYKMFSVFIKWFKQQYDKLSETEQKQLEIDIDIKASEQEISYELKDRLDFLAYMKQIQFQCPVCLDDIDPYEFSRDVILLKCQHRIHAACYNQLRSHRGSENFVRCPKCRAPIETKKDYTPLHEYSELRPKEFKKMFPNQPMKSQYCVQL